MCCSQTIEKRNIHHVSGLDERKRYHNEVLYVINFFSELWEGIVGISGFGGWNFIVLSNEFCNNLKPREKKLLQAFVSISISNSMRKVFEHLDDEKHRFIWQIWTSGKTSNLLKFSYSSCFYFLRQKEKHRRKGICARLRATGPAAIIDHHHVHLNHITKLLATTNS